MPKLTILQQFDPYNANVARFAVCDSYDACGKLVVLSNHRTRELAREWIQHYLKTSDVHSGLEWNEPITVTEAWQPNTYIVQLGLGRESGALSAD